MTTPTSERRPRDVNDGGWHLDKKVPISLIVVIVLQGVSFTWYVGKLDSRVTIIETTRIDYRAQQHDRDQRQDEAVAEAVGQLRTQLDRIDTKLDRVNDKLSERK